MRKLYNILILIVLSFIALSFAGCNGDSFTNVPNDGAFPVARTVATTINQPVRVNLYIQATSDMLPLLDEGSIYVDMVRILQGNAGNLWGSHGASLHTFRFDVEWLENRSEEGYGPLTAQHFAYPLDPHWWQRPGNVAPQIPQIFEPEFYQLEWYFSQYLRAPDAYRNRIEHNSPAFNNRGLLRLSRTFEEITYLRNGQHEISIVVTNFLGHSVDNTPLEDETTRDQILSYLNNNPQNAIALFTFVNNGEPFHFIVLGSSTETTAFSNHLIERLPVGSFQFNFYTHAPIASRISTNAAISSGNPSVDVVQRSIPVGVAQVFDVDLSDDEPEAFSRHFGGTHVFYHINSSNIDGRTAALAFDIRLYIPYRISRLTSFEPELSFFELRDYVLEPIDYGISEFVINSKSPQPDGGTQANVTVLLDSAIVPRARTLLIVRLYENVELPLNLNIPTTPLFQSTFTQLAQDVNLSAQQRRLQSNRNIVAELYLYFLNQ